MNGKVVMVMSLFRLEPIIRNFEFITGKIIWLQNRIHGLLTMVWAAKYFRKRNISLSEKQSFFEENHSVCRHRRFVRFYQTVTHYGMIASHHPSIRHRGKKAPFGLPRRKGNLSRTLSLKIYKSETFLYPAFSDFQQPVSLCCTSEHRPAVASQPTFRRWSTEKF